MLQNSQVGLDFAVILGVFEHPSWPLASIPVYSGLQKNYTKVI